MLKVVLNQLNSIKKKGVFKFEFRTQNFHSPYVTLCIEKKYKKALIITCHIWILSKLNKLFASFYNYIVKLIYLKKKS